jgi:acetyltransferase-like isoleucine patch superfamily enzyme
MGVLVASGVGVQVLVGSGVSVGMGVFVGVSVTVKVGLGVLVGVAVGSVREIRLSAEQASNPAMMIIATTRITNRFFMPFITPPF